MYSTIFGFRVNLFYGVFVVAAFDIINILVWLCERYEVFKEFESAGKGCMNNWSASHCESIYAGLSLNIITLILSCYMIFGALMVREFRKFKVSTQFNFSAQTDLHSRLDSSIGLQFVGVSAVLYVVLRPSTVVQ